ncbi:MAG: aminotransferase class I/II-fold pyridoxal phosphate-dependent enzyme [candidate division Zixibacteria bacterium]
MSSKFRKINQKPIVTPIYQTTTFEFPDTDSIIQYQKGKKKGYLYTRYDNPTIEAVEIQMARLDKAESSLLFSSGMAAISGACFTLLTSGDEIISSAPVYGGTQSLFDRFLKKYGIKIRYFPANDTGKLARAISSKTKFIYLESPTNPNLQIVDMKTAAKIARENRIFTLIDSTFASPVNQKPLDFGIDAVMHSATKYLGGHSDIMGGVLSGSSTFIKRVRESRKLLGSCADPNQAFLLDRGLKTLTVRMEKINNNALAVAEFLETIPGLKTVIYPGLDSHPQRSVGISQMSGFGGIVSFDIGSAKMAARFADSLKVIKNAVSLGGTESLISLPIWTSHHGIDRKKLVAMGITPGLIRLSIGLEDKKELITDIKRAIRKSLK